MCVCVCVCVYWYLQVYLWGQIVHCIILGHFGKYNLERYECPMSSRINVVLNIQLCVCMCVCVVCMHVYEISLYNTYSV